MGKIKDQLIRVMELYDDGVPPRSIALFLGMSVEQVVEILESVGRSDEPADVDYESR